MHVHPPTLDEAMPFTIDHTSSNIPVWLQALRKFVGVENVCAVEIGALEGRSSVWFLTHVLTHPTARLVCVDPAVAPGFEQNVAPVADRLTLVPRSSQDALAEPGILPATIDFAYIDGDHAAASVLQDAVACFTRLKPGGVLIFDDYPWLPSESSHPTEGPGIAINAFLAVYERRYRLLHKEWQVVIEKL